MQRLAPVRRKDDSPRSHREVLSGIRPLVPLFPALMLSVNSQSIAVISTLTPQLDSIFEPVSMLPLGKLQRDLVIGYFSLLLEPGGRMVPP